MAALALLGPLADRAATAAFAAEAGRASAPLSAPSVTAANLRQDADGAELSFALSRAVEVHAFTLASPDRVILDLPEVAFRIEEGELDPARRVGRPRPGLVASVRFGLLAPGRSRVVLGLSGPGRVLSAGMARDATGTAVLLLKLARGGAIEPAQPVAAATAPAARVAAAAVRPVIVIDPGHGGPDRGAERGGIVEKDLTLAFARALAAKLEAGGRYGVVMTRADDSFIALSERVGVARRAGAALLISVHADTLPEMSRDAAEVSGATVYTVGDRASDGHAAALAAKENSADAAAGLAGPAAAADVNDILFDLARQETRAYSHVFARTLVNYWKEVGRLNKNPQRSAGFVVLKAPDVPSVLVELGYLSSPADAASFQSADWRERATVRMAEAVDEYFAGRGVAAPPQRSAGLAPPR